MDDNWRGIERDEGAKPYSQNVDKVWKDNNDKNHTGCQPFSRTTKSHPI